MLANNDLKEETEEYVYGWTSFLAEFGGLYFYIFVNLVCCLLNTNYRSFLFQGALGLFLGFSFYSLWDLFGPMILLTKNCRKKLNLCFNKV